MAMFDVDLSGTVAVVTGASRGAGRGTALVLGEAGATVYVTGRSVRGAPSGPGREGTIDETAEAVEARGGSGIPVRCDHTSDADVRSLFERVRREQGRLDLLVNNAWGGYEQRSGEPEVAFFDTPFWDQPLWRWDGMFTAGVRAHLLASRHAAPLLIQHRDEHPGLIVSTIAWAFGAYLGNVLYDTAKAATAAWRSVWPRTSARTMWQPSLSPPGTSAPPRPPNTSAAPSPPSRPTRTSWTGPGRC